MEKYEDMVYKCPGPFSRNGGTYDTKGVQSEDEHKAALVNGWFKTMPEAIEGRSAVVEAADAPPTRDELEQKAKELGVKFDKKTTDEALSKKISEALGV